MAVFMELSSKVKPSSGMVTFPSEKERSKTPSLSTKEIVNGFWDM